MSLSSTGGAHELGLRKKIGMVRDALLEMNVNGSRQYSKDDLSIALQYYDLDVDRTVQAFLEDGAVEALGEWNKPTRATSRPSASAASVSTAAQNGDAAETGSASSHSKKKKRKNKPTTVTGANGDSSASVKANTNGDSASNGHDDAAHDTNGDSSSSVPLAVANGDAHASSATENGHGSLEFDSGNAQINGQASSGPAADSRASLKSANALSAGESFIKTVISANILEPSDADADYALPNGESQRAMPQRSRAKRVETKKPLRELDSQSADAHDHDASSTAASASATSVQPARTRNPSGSTSSQRTRSNSTANAIGALIESLSRSEHELSRFALEFERRRNKCTRDLDSTAARIERQFKAAHDRLEERRRAIVSEFAFTRTAVEHYLDARSLVATELRERIVRLQTVNPNCLSAADTSAQLNGDAVSNLEVQIEAVRNEVRALSSTLSRRIDEAAFSTIRFEFDDSTLFSGINGFGHIVPFNPARVGRTMSSASATVESQAPEQHAISSSDDTQGYSKAQLPTNAAPLVDQPPADLSSADDDTRANQGLPVTVTNKPEYDAATTTTNSQDETSADANGDIAVDANRDRSRHESRRAYDARRTVTYSFDVVSNDDDDAAQAHNRAATYGGRNWQPNASANASVEREHSANRRRFNGDLYNPPYEPVARTVRHSQSHPAYASDAYANSNWNNRNSNEYNSTNGISNGYAKRSANAADYAAHNGYAHAHSNGFTNTNARYSHYSSNSSRAYTTPNVQNRLSTFDQTHSGRQNSFESDSRNYAYPRERDSLVFVPRNSRGAPHGAASPHGTAARPGRPPSSQSSSNGVRATASIKSDATRLEERAVVAQVRDQLETDDKCSQSAPETTSPRAPGSSEQSAIDWVNVVEQDEEARRNEAGTQLAFVDAPDS